MVQGQVLKKYEKDPAFFFEERPVRPLKDNEVRIEMHYAMINPSDLAFIQGGYGFKKKLPVVAGFEGSGIIKEVHESVSDWEVGQKVAASADFRGDGAWATEMVTSADNCFALDENTTLEMGARLIVNPLTVEGLLEAARGHEAVVHTAAASSLGRMLAVACKERGIGLVAVVRRAEQEKVLRDLGVETVINSSDDSYLFQFKKAVKKLQATCLLDAVAGPVAGSLWEEMPAGSELVCYGAMSEQNIPVNPGRAIFQGKKISGFWLTSWLALASPDEKKQAAVRAQKAMQTIYEPEEFTKISFKDLPTALEKYKSDMTAQKPLLVIREG